MSERNENLATYLRDHYAGGVGALELLERLTKTHGPTALKLFFNELRTEVTSDHEQLHQIMTALGIEESSLRDATAWIAEKFSSPKLGSAGQTNQLPLLQALETLFMGICGKRMLWRSLDAIEEKESPLQRFDFQQLEMRATQQLETVEAKRMEIAHEALDGSNGDL